MKTVTDSDSDNEGSEHEESDEHGESESEEEDSPWAFLIPQKNIIDLSVVNPTVIDQSLRSANNKRFSENIIDLSVTELNLDKLRSIVDLLIKHPLFKNITVEGWQASMEAFKIVTQGMRHANALRRINCSCLELQDERFDALAEVLLNKNIIAADISSNYPSLTSFRKLSQIVSCNSSVTRLVLSGCRLGDEAIKILSDDLMAQKSALKELTLSFNNIGPQGIQALSIMLLQNTQIMSLDLSNNNLGCQGAHALSEMLLHHQQLIYLGLSDNNIGDLGMTHLAIALRKNSTLTHLYCCGNSITYQGAAEVVYTMSKNTSLKQINLSFNLIHEQFITFYKKYQKKWVPSQIEPEKACELDLMRNKARTKPSVSLPWLYLNHRKHEKTLGKVASLLLKFSRIILTASQNNDGDKAVPFPLEVKELILQQLDTEQILTTTQTKNIFRYAADKTTLFASSTKDHFLNSIACDRVMKPYALNFKD